MKKEKDKIPLAVNFRKLQQYHFDYFDLEEIIFFEYLVVLAQWYGFKQFYHSQPAIQKETGLKRAKQESIIKKFKEIGILRVEVKGMPKVKWFTLDFGQIYNLLQKIYEEDEERIHSTYFFKLSLDYDRPSVETSRNSVASNLQENINTENNNKHINKNINKETIKDNLDVFVNNEMHVQLPFSSGEFQTAWDEWVNYRKDNNLKFSVGTAKAQLNYLSQYQEQTAIAMINNSIVNGWSGIFPIKENKTTAPPQSKYIIPQWIIDMQKEESEKLELLKAELQTNPSTPLPETNDNYEHDRNGELPF